MQKHPSSSYARILFRHLRLSEERSQAFLRGTNVTYEELMTLDGTIPREQACRIYRNALAISGREDLGLSVGTQFRMSSHGPLGVATFSGPNLRTGLVLLAKYGQTREDFFKITVSEHPKGMQITLTETFDLSDLREFLTESVLSGIFTAINFFSGETSFKGQVNFAYPKPPYWQTYQNHFAGDIKFGQPATAVIVPESILSLPSPAPDPELHRQAIVLCEQQLKNIKAGEADAPAVSTKAAVSKLIYENPGRIWTLPEVAAKLHMSRRTLIRRLAAEGTRFQSVRDEMAKKQVADYLTDANLSVESIGYLMGFSDASSFRRSFKRWFGETPSHYIARLRGGCDA